MKYSIILILSTISLLFFIYFIITQPINIEWYIIIAMILSTTIFILSILFNKYYILYFIHKYIYQPFFYVVSLLFNNHLLILYCLLSLLTVMITWSYFDFCIIDFVSQKYVYTVAELEYYVLGLSVIILFFKLLSIRCNILNLIIFLIQLYIYVRFLYYNFKYPDKYLTKLNSIPIILK